MRRGRPRLQPSRGAGHASARRSGAPAGSSTPGRGASHLGAVASNPARPCSAVCHPAPAARYPEIPGHRDTARNGPLGLAQDRRQSGLLRRVSGQADPNCSQPRGRDTGERVVMRGVTLWSVAQHPGSWSDRGTDHLQTPSRSRRQTPCGVGALRDPGASQKPDPPIHPESQSWETSVLRTRSSGHALFCHHDRHDPGGCRHHHVGHALRIPRPPGSQEARRIHLVALTDAAIAESIANLSDSSSFGGVTEREFGGGSIASDIESLPENRRVILATASYRG